MYKGLHESIRYFCQIVMKLEFSKIRSQMYKGLNASIRYFCQIVMKLEFSQHIFGKYSNIKFHKKFA
jgi:hypothetical protein